MCPLGGFDPSYEDVIVDYEFLLFSHFLLKLFKLTLCQIERLVVERSVEIVHFD